MSQDIADFLRARYAEARALANDATPGPWTAEQPERHPRWGDHGYNHQLWGDNTLLAEFNTEYDGGLNAVYTAAYNPQHTLADLDAKERIIEDTWGGPDHEEMWAHHLRLLALPYADHPDYRKEWRPWT